MSKLAARGESNPASECLGPMLWFIEVLVSAGRMEFDDREEHLEAFFNAHAPDFGFLPPFADSEKPLSADYNRIISKV